MDTKRVVQSLRNSSIILWHMSGASTKVNAEHHGISQRQVQRIIRTNERNRLRQRVQDVINGLIPEN